MVLNAIGLKTVALTEEKKHSNLLSLFILTISGFRGYLFVVKCNATKRKVHYH